jgi:hypothetical protein
MSEEQGYKIHRTSLGECAVVLDLGAVDRNPMLLLFPVFLLTEYRDILPTLTADSRKAAWERRVKACEDEAALRQANGKRDAWNGSRALREAMAV